MVKLLGSTRFFGQLGISIAVIAGANLVSPALAQDRGSGFLTGGSGSEPMQTHYNDSTAPNTGGNSFNSSYGGNSYSPASNSNRPSFGGIPDAVRRVTQGHHGAMPNPATMQLAPGDPVAARQAEHQNILNQMRKHGASAGQMQTYREQTEDAPGTTYTNMGGIRVRNDGMTPGQALQNITHSGLMNTPISTDPHHYAQGTYGYYKTHGGTLNYADWLETQRH